ncbi:MAG: hypothetical protein Pg6B_11020 [Candidatus Azobacteroides pseudotrichonymphae]|nr:MAG: hypothetical protein Pg6B_11020 [Candidatus Azobacteroides pseudotrichonymphae]
MKKSTLTIAIFLFLIAPIGASGTVIHMRHPALATTVEISCVWNNEIWIKMEKTDREFHEKSDAFDATYDAWLDGPNVVIQLAWVGEKESEGDVKGKAVYNKLNAFLNECGVPFTSWFRFDTASILSPRNWGHFFWIIPQEYVRDVTID